MGRNPSKGQRVMPFYRHEPIKVGYHPAKFGGPGHSDSGDIVKS